MKRIDGTPGRIALRLRVEAMARQLGEEVVKACPPGFGFMLWVAESGNGGSHAYVSSFERGSAVTLAEEWLAGEGNSLAEMNYHLRRRIEDLEESLETLRATVGAT